MRVKYTNRFLVSYKKAPFKIRSAVDRKIELLITNLRHPSLCSKKYDETRGVWQARVNNDWSFYFLIEGHTYHLIYMMRHPK